MHHPVLILTILFCDPKKIVLNHRPAKTPQRQLPLLESPDLYCDLASIMVGKIGITEGSSRGKVTKLVMINRFLCFLSFFLFINFKKSSYHNLNIFSFLYQPTSISIYLLHSVDKNSFAL